MTTDAKGDKNMTSNRASFVKERIKKHDTAAAAEAPVGAAPSPAPTPAPTPAPAPSTPIKARRGSITLVGQLTGWQRGKAKEGEPKEKKMQEILISVPVKVLDVFKANVAGSRSAVIAALIASAVERIERGEDIVLRAEDLKHWFE